MSHNLPATNLGRIRALATLALVVLALAPNAEALQRSSPSAESVSKLTPMSQSTTDTASSGAGHPRLWDHRYCHMPVDSEDTSSVSSASLGADPTHSHPPYGPPFPEPTLPSHHHKGNRVGKSNAKGTESSKNKNKETMSKRYDTNTKRLHSRDLSRRTECDPMAEDGFECGASPLASRSKFKGLSKGLTDILDPSSLMPTGDGDTDSDSPSLSLPLELR